MDSNNPSSGDVLSSGNNPSPIHQSASADIIAEEQAARVVVFPEDEKIMAGPRSKGVDMKRTLTQEEKDLAAAGYDHLHRKDDKADNVGNVDIVEHQFNYDDLVETLKTNIDTKDPGQSHGLTSEEAKLRLQRDGHNILTPPKKKSALRKV